MLIEVGFLKFTSLILVVSGTIKGRSIKVKDKLYLGPKNGEFKEITVRSIHNSIRQNVDEINDGVQGCFAIKFNKKNDTILRKDIKKGI